MNGFYQESGNNISTCSQSGEWGKVSVRCKGRVTVLSHAHLVGVLHHRRLQGSLKTTRVHVKPALKPIEFDIVF